MFGAPYIEVNGHPIFDLFRIRQGGGVFRIDVTQVIPAATGPLGHGVGFPFCGAAATGAGGIHPRIDGGQRAFSGSRGFIASHIGEGQGEVFFFQRDDATFFTVNHGNGLTPVPLAAEVPVP